MADEKSNIYNLSSYRDPSGDHDPLKHGGGGGTFDGMEARVAKLEALAEHIQRDLTDVKTDLRTIRDDARSDFRLIFGAIIALAIGLTGVMAKGFGWL